METTIYPKCAKLRVFYYIETFFFIMRAIGLILIIALISRVHPLDDGDSTYKILISTDMVLFILYYVLQTVGFVYLLLGYRKKDHQRLRICCSVNIVLLGIMVLIEIINLIEERHTGVVSVTIPLLLMAYRGLLIKIVYDAFLEVEANPLNVPFVQMRDCEDSV